MLRRRYHGYMIRSGVSDSEPDSMLSLLSFAPRGDSRLSHLGQACFRREEFEKVGRRRDVVDRPAVFFMGNEGVDFSKAGNISSPDQHGWLHVLIAVAWCWARRLCDWRCGGSRKFHLPSVPREARSPLGLVIDPDKHPSDLQKVHLEKDGNIWRMVYDSISPELCPVWVGVNAIGYQLGSHG